MFIAFESQGLTPKLKDELETGELTQLWFLLDCTIHLQSMQSTTLLIAFVALCSSFPLAMGDSASSVRHFSPQNQTDLVPNNVPTDTQSKNVTSTDPSKDAGKDDSTKIDTKDEASTPDSSSVGAAGGAGPTADKPKMIAGDMSSGKCMCPSPAGGSTTPPPDTKDAKQTTPQDGGSSLPTKTPDTTTPPPTNDNNSTSSATTMSEHAAFFTGLVSVAVASLVV
ncbi:hypothetical protein VP01_117g2 [Puccinia sorghi]|uniref:Uncharacterized protein n=1 Tax=Puccinia sorghi TaxID=27349 RepID=A0A0L6VR42_9BASI|nr:hypothetical protein VP01_117g2 [Puccinia sorghi]